MQEQVLRERTNQIAEAYASLLASGIVLPVSDFLLIRGAAAQELQNSNLYDVPEQAGEGQEEATNTVRKRENRNFFEESLDFSGQKTDNVSDLGENSKKNSGFVQKTVEKSQKKLQSIDIRGGSNIKSRHHASSAAPDVSREAANPQRITEDKANTPEPMLADSTLHEDEIYSGTQSVVSTKPLSDFEILRQIKDEWN